MGYSHQSADVKAAYDRILEVAKSDTSASTVCEDFLFSWFNVRTWGGWAPHSIAGLDKDNASALLTLLESIKKGTWYPESIDIECLIITKRRKPLRA